MKKVITILVGTMLASSLAMAGSNMGRYEYKAEMSYEAQGDEFVQCRRSSGITGANEILGTGLAGIGSPIQDPAVHQKVRNCMTAKGYKMLTENEVEDVCMKDPYGTNPRLDMRLCLFLW